MEMSGQFIERFNVYLLDNSLILGIVFINFSILFLLFLLLSKLIRAQIDHQIKYIIPIKAVRKRVGISIKWIN